MKEILDNYNLKIKNTIMLQKGYVSKKWIITDSNNKQYVLKEIVKQKKDRLDFILSVQSNLKKFVAPIIPTKENELFVTYNNKFYYLCEFIKEIKYPVNESTIENIGDFLASIHLEMMKNNKYCEYLKIENNENLLQEYSMYYKKHNNYEYLNIINYKINILKKLKDKDINFDNLTKQIIHGDFYLDNILYNGNTFKIIDFDQCCNFYKEYEILRGMFMICNKNKLLKQEILYNMSKFINGYLRKNTIKSSIDAYNLYLYVQANSLSSIKPSDCNNPNKKQFALKRFETLKFLNENKADIIKILEGEYL